MGKIYCVMGKSSSGKDTVYKKLKEQYKEFRLIVPYTTRPIREGEKDGVEYYFVDPEQFRAMKEDGKVIESRSYNTKCGIWTYFTADDGQIDLSAADYLLIGTLVSYQALREYFGEEAIVPVYLEVEDGLRLARALTQVNNVAKAYINDENFGSLGNDLSMWKFYNLLTGANKSSYIDSFLDRAYNATELATGICSALHGDDKYQWFLS